MKRLLILMTAIIFLILFVPLTIVMLMSKTMDNSTPFEAPETAETIKVYIKNSDTVADMDIHTYLTGVTAAEMPSDFETEAIKAQAVAARTYLASNIYEADSGNADETHKGAVICTDSTHCQAWISEGDFKKIKQDGDKKWDKVSNAVSDTSGEIIKYKNKPISAVFFSTSWGQTENAEDVWGKKTDYLKSVKSYGDELSPKYTSEVVLSIEDFKNTAEKSLSGVDWSRELYSDIVRSSSGGIKSIKIGGAEVKGIEFRKIFNLRSTNAELEQSDGNIRISVKGFGHNVGMSQYGANYLASHGKNYKEIIKSYYSGVSVKKR